MRRLGPALLAGAVAVAVAGLTGLAGAGGAVAASEAGGSVRVGDETLTRCHVEGAPAWCGSLAVPLDRTDPSAGTIAIGFGWIPASGEATGTIVAQEGGPGYPSTGSAADYLDMIGPLHATRNLLVVDARGTGRSALLNCAALQHFKGNTATEHFRRLVGACGDQLNHTYRRADGSFVHASDLFDTANSARDLADVLAALHLSDVDLYGDSYGTYFAQSFLSQSPQLLRSVTLDSAYEARDLDPWYITTVTTARTAFEAACTRSLACDAAAGAGAWARIGLLAKSLRAHPVSGRVPGVDATLVPTVVGIRELVDLVNDAGYDYAVYRSLDAAARDYLDHGDARPLLRLYAEDWGYDDSDYYGPVRTYSDGLFYAVSCTDYPQLFDLHASPAKRREELAASIKALPAGTFAPFTTAEWISMDAYTEAYTACLDWPAPTHPADPPVKPGVSMDATHVPVLITNGDLDSLTPAAGGAHIQRQIGPAARNVVLANMVHLSALYDRYGCGASIYRAFVRRPGRLHSLDVSCAPDVPEVHTLGTFARTLAGMPPATVISGSASITQRRLVSTLVAAVGDAAYRYQYVDGVDDLGLRGGTVHFTTPSGAVVVHLHGVRWTTDTSVTGSATTDDYGLGVAGTLTVTGPAGQQLTGAVTVTTTGQHAVATVTTAAATYQLPAP